jgi:ferredoxin/flavodoxin---NADP+ reductase
MPKYAVVGAGPAGFYAAAALLRRSPSARIDIIEALPVPFGLVRYGVAPDHPATKAFTSVFSRFVADAGTHIRFFGNVALSPPQQGVPAVPPLSDLYDLVVYATGAARPRTLPNDPRSPLPLTVRTAQDFVFWLNGHPHMHGPSAPPAPFNPGCDRVIVVGAGNVSLDIARILLRNPDDLRCTDISPVALEAVTQKPISEVALFARRGPQHAAWTTASLREVLTKIPGMHARCDPDIVERDMLDASVPRTSKRMLKVLSDHATNREQTGGRLAPILGHRLLSLNFHLSPVSFRMKNAVHDQETPNSADRAVDNLLVTFANNLETTTCKSVSSSRTPPRPVAVPVQSAEQFVEEKCGLALLSLGYEGGKPAPGQVCVGWANGKGKGIVGDNRWDAESVVAGLTDAQLGLDRTDRPVAEGIDSWLQNSDVDHVSWSGWERIDAEERRRGPLVHPDRERCKIESIHEMLEFSNGPLPRSLAGVGMSSS